LILHYGAVSTCNITRSDVAGMVVDSVAIDQSDEEFRQSLLYLGLAALTNAVFTSLRGTLFSFAIARFKLRYSV
jgi:hypothetical protein